MKIGINKMGFYAPEFYIEQADLATARGIDPNKFTQGLGQLKMSVCPVTQDAISMAANAAYTLLDDQDRATIDLVIFATESGVDYSKAGATTIHQLLKIQPFARCYEIKQACYGLTAALNHAHAYIALHPKRQVLVVGSDISRYGLNTSGEPTQGAGAVAMVISINPKIAYFSGEPAYYSEDIYDFFRPEHETYAIVDGHYSNEKYLEFVQKTTQRFNEINHTSLDHFDALCFHIPYAKIGLKSLRSLVDESTSPQLYDAFKSATYYNQLIGNIYTGSLYLSLLSLLEQHNLKPGATIGLFSYGSGAVGEFFQLKLADHYQSNLHRDENLTRLSQRTALSVSEYEVIFNQTLVENVSQHDQAPFYLEGIFDRKRRYKSNV